MKVQPDSKINEDHNTTWQIVLQNLLLNLRDDFLCAGTSRVLSQLMESFLDTLRYHGLSE